MNERIDKKRGSPLVSVIIPTLNSEKTIGNCLLSLREQTYRNIEVIVVDRYSSDNTRRIAKKFGAKVYLAGIERTVQVNYGATKAKGDFIYYIGSDFVLDKELVEKAVTQAIREKADGVKIPNLAIGETFWGRCRALEKMMNVGENTIEVPRFVRKKVFLHLGGYDESVVAEEEWDFGIRFEKAGYKSVRITDVAEWHLGEPQCLSEIIRRAWYYGKTGFRYIKKHPKISLKQFSPIRPFWLSKWRDHTSNPMLLTGIILMKNIEYLSALLGKFADILVSRGI